MTTVTTLRLPTRLYEWTKKHARSKGQTFPSFLRVTLEQLKHDEEQAARKAKIANIEAIDHERNNPSYYK